MLVQKVKGKALRGTNTVERHNGLMAWRFIQREYKPDVGGRHNAMLVGLLAPNFPVDRPFDESLATWTLAVDQYEKETGDLISDRTRIAVISKYAPDSARAMVLQSAALAENRWSKFRASLSTYFQCGKSYDFAGLPASSSGAAPMEIGGIDTKCQVCGKNNHTTANCFKNPNRKGGKKGDSKGSKSKSKDKNAKNKDRKFEGTCNY